MFCKCSQEIPDGRVKFMQKYKPGQPITCVLCSTTEKKGGFMSTSGKTEREIIIADMDVIADLHHKSHRVGTGIARGSRMQQNQSSKYLK